MRTPSHRLKTSDLHYYAASKKKGWKITITEKGLAENGDWPEDIWFIGTTGWVMGSNGIERTIDNGATWQTIVASDYPIDGDNRAGWGTELCFNTATHGWLHLNGNYSYCRLYETNDGGLTWTPRDISGYNNPPTLYGFRVVEGVSNLYIRTGGWYNWNDWWGIQLDKDTSTFGDFTQMNGDIAQGSWWAIYQMVTRPYSGNGVQEQPILFAPTEHARYYYETTNMSDISTETARKSDLPNGWSFRIWKKPYMSSDNKVVTMLDNGWMLLKGIYDNGTNDFQWTRITNANGISNFDSFNDVVAVNERDMFATITTTTDQIEYPTIIGVSEDGGATWEGIYTIPGNWQSTAMWYINRDLFYIIGCDSSVTPEWIVRCEREA